MARLANGGEQPRVGEELRQDVVLNLTSHARFVRTVATDDEDLPVLARHHLKGDARAVR